LLKLSSERESVVVVVVVVVDDDVVVDVFSGGTTLRTAPILTIFGVMKAAAGFELDRSGFELDRTGFGLDATCNSAARFRRDKKMSAIGILEKLMK
jgi:hypothetical protein